MNIQDIEEFWDKIRSHPIKTTLIATICIIIFIVTAYFLGFFGEIGKKHAAIDIDDLDVAGDIDEIFFANMDDGKIPIQNQDSLCAISLYLVNNTRIPIPIRKVDFKLIVNGELVAVRPAIPNPHDAWVNFEAGEDTRTVRWKDNLLLNKLRNTPLQPGIPRRGYVTFVFPATPKIVDAIKNDDFDLAISFESFQRDEYSIILKHGIPINFVGTLPITQVFYTKDGYTHFSYAHDRIPFKKKEVPR